MADDTSTIGQPAIDKYLAASQTVIPTDDAGLLKHKSRTAAFKVLLDCFSLQIRYGCEIDLCTTPSCFSYRKLLVDQPVRRPTVLTARDEAFVLASADDPLQHLCVHPLRTSAEGDGRVDTELVHVYVHQLLSGATTKVAGDGTITSNGCVDEDVDHVESSSETKICASHEQPQAKMDSGSLTQNLFNSATMRAWFSGQAPEHISDMPSTFQVHHLKAIEYELLLFRLSEKAQGYHVLDRARFHSIYHTAFHTIRYCLTSPRLLLNQWTYDGPPVELAKLLGPRTASVTDTQGNVIKSIRPLASVMINLVGITNDTVRKHVFDCMCDALDPVFVGPKPTAAASPDYIHGGDVSTFTSNEPALKDQYLNDEQAAQIIFLAVRTLVLSVAPSDANSLERVLASRREGLLITTPEDDAADQNYAHELQERELRVSESFEFEPAVRLAEKVVSALAARRVQWRAASKANDENGNTGDVGERKTFPVLQLVLAHMLGQAGQPAPTQSDGSQGRREQEWVRDMGLPAGPIFLEWLSTVFRAEWDGSYTFDPQTRAGAALEILADMYPAFGLNSKDLLGSDRHHYHLPVLSKAIHAHKAVKSYLQWVDINSSDERTQNKQRHLLEYPFLFCHADRCSPFRLMMYHQMYHEWQFADGQYKTMEHFMWAFSSDSADYQCPDDDCTHAMCERVRFRQQQMRRWRDAGYSQSQRFPSNFWQRDLYLRTKLAKAQAKFLLLDIERQTILESAFNQLWGREKRELLKPLKVVMRMDGRDEDAADHGGVSQEFFRLVLARAFDPQYGLFAITDETTKMNWFQALSTEPLQTYELLGMLFGMAVYNGITLPVSFPFALYSVLCNGAVPNASVDISDGWSPLSDSLDKLETWDEEANGSIEDVLARDFAFSFKNNGITYTVDMQDDKPSAVPWPNNPGDAPPSHWTDDTRTFQPVTAANRYAFIDAYKEWLVIHSVRPQLDAFTKGFHHIVPRSTTAFLTATSLQALVEGTRHIHISQLKAATSYPVRDSEAPTPTYADDFSSTHPTVKHFWNVVSKYDQAKLRKLLTFVTASDRVPAAGYEALGFSVEKNGDIGSLPTSSTCFGKLFLPPYESEEQLGRMLGVAVEEGSNGFGFM